MNKYFFFMYKRRNHGIWLKSTVGIYMNQHNERTFCHGLWSVDVCVFCWLNSSLYSFHTGGRCRGTVLAGSSCRSWWPVGVLQLICNVPLNLQWGICGGIPHLPPTDNCLLKNTFKCCTFLVKMLIQWEDISILINWIKFRYSKSHLIFRQKQIWLRFGEHSLFTN